MMKMVTGTVVGVGLGAAVLAGAGAASASTGHGEDGKPGQVTTTNVSVTSTKIENEGNVGQSGAAGNGGSVTNTKVTSWESNYTSTVNRIRDSFNTYTDNSRHVLSSNSFANGNLSGNSIVLFSGNKLTFVAFNVQTNN